MKTRKREIAKAGIFGSIDNPTIVTEKDLKEIAETFPEQKTAPIQFGHWADAGSPRLGNVVSVSFDPVEKSLSAEIEEQDVLNEAVENGFYPDVSIGAKQRASDGKMYLHHLAYLGEEPPAIKDLKKEINDTLNSNDLAASDKGNLISFPGTNAKRLYLSDEPINEVNKSTMGTGARPPEIPLSGGQSPAAQKQEESSMTPEEEKNLRDENTRLKTENEQKEKLLSDSFTAQRNAEKEVLRKAVAGKLTEPETERLMLLADSFDSSKKILLSDGKTQKEESPLSVLASIFATMPRKVEPGSLALSDDGQMPPETEGISFENI